MIRKTIEKICKDYTRIENYEEAVNSPERWTCHHRLEAVLTSEELRRAGWYLDRKPEELIFLKEKEHGRNPDIHISFRRNRLYQASEEAKKKRFKFPKGRKLSEEHRRKISKALKGRKQSEERRKLNSESHKGLKQSEESNRKRSEALKGRQWFNNGVVSKHCFECPDGFVPGMLKGGIKNEKVSKCFN